MHQRSLAWLRYLVVQHPLQISAGIPEVCANHGSMRNSRFALLKNWIGVRFGQL
jgi:hypothetical protein